MSHQVKACYSAIVTLKEISFWYQNREVDLTEQDRESPENPGRCDDWAFDKVDIIMNGAKEDVKFKAVLSFFLLPFFFLSFFPSLYLNFLYCPWAHVMEEEPHST